MQVNCEAALVSERIIANLTELSMSSIYSQPVAALYFILESNYRITENCLHVSGEVTSLSLLWDFMSLCV